MLQSPRFSVGKPIWPVGMEREQNLDVGFTATLNVPDVDGVTLRIAAASLYRVFVNGFFRCHGPSRTAPGFFRVDQWRLDAQIRPGHNVVAVEVVGYNLDSSYVPSNPSFLQAEMVCDGRVLAATGHADRGFDAFPLGQRVRRIQRYNNQRTFMEAYRLAPGYDAWRVDPAAPPEPAPVGVCGDKRLIATRTPQPTFDLSAPTWHVAAGRWRTGLTPGHPRRVPPPEEQSRYDVLPTLELQTITPASRTSLDQPIDGPLRIDLPADTWHILDFGRNITGFIGATVTCAHPTRFYLTFDEILIDGEVRFLRNRSDVVRYELAAGRYQLETFEPYGLRYLQLVALDGGCTVEDVYLRRLENPVAVEGAGVGGAQFACSDQGLNRIFDAGRATFAQNAVDLLMDCPSRERAGWLCDSFFSSRAEPDLTGRCDVEAAFLENFTLPESVPNLPPGMVPMCYPADFSAERCTIGMFIPNWAMWFVLELEEYLHRSGDRTIVDALRPKVMALLDYFEPFRNERGLLENLESWVFIEWSRANDFVQDVNFPSNMLFAACLDAAGRLYGLPKLGEQATVLRDAIRNMSFDGEFFVDNAIRQDGKLIVTRNRTEVCQYYSFFCDVANPTTHAQLWRTLRDAFGPKRTETGEHQDVHPANMFIGDYLRLELLSRYGEYRQLLDEMRGYLLHMAQRTGTLWEMQRAEDASCCHGFASHVCHGLYRDALGLATIDRPNRKITVRLADNGLAWCRGRVPTRDGCIAMDRWVEAGVTHWRLLPPSGWSVAITRSGAGRFVRLP